MEIEKLQRFVLDGWSNKKTELDKYAKTIVFVKNGRKIQFDTYMTNLAVKVFFVGSYHSE